MAGVLLPEFCFQLAKLGRVAAFGGPIRGRINHLVHKVVVQGFEPALHLLDLCMNLSRWPGLCLLFLQEFFHHRVIELFGLPIYFELRQDLLHQQMGLFGPDALLSAMVAVVIVVPIPGMASGGAAR
ncbi:MAG: hypothetical protein EOO14_11270 [Chitinophagaceae bacterium]|nr:MAG: hypothetical protein EOO14_11270 [Chitinophagaceae bacterium]